MATKEAPIIYGLKNLEKDTPELKKAITSVLLANLEVNKITERNKNNGNNRFAKYIVKSRKYCATSGKGTSLAKILSIFSAR